jgi:hypothetical protein
MRTSRVSCLLAGVMSVGAVHAQQGAADMEAFYPGGGNHPALDCIFEQLGR